MRDISLGELGGGCCFPTRLQEEPVNHDLQLWCGKKGFRCGFIFSSPMVSFLESCGFVFGSSRFGVVSVGSCRVYRGSSVECACCFSHQTWLTILLPVKNCLRRNVLKLLFLSVFILFYFSGIRIVAPCQNTWTTRVRRSTARLSLFMSRLFAVNGNVFCPNYDQTDPADWSW